MMRMTKAEETQPAKVAGGRWRRPEETWRCWRLPGLEVVTGDREGATVAEQLQAVRNNESVVSAGKKERQRNLTIWTAKPIWDSIGSGEIR